jgi:hypothetical protein
MSAPDRLAELRAAVEAPHPDARLIAACYRLEMVMEERDRIFRQKGKGWGERLHATMPEHDALEAEIAGLRARTEAGLRAKAEVALFEMPSGGIFSLARSSLLDLLGRRA